jgi:hypothetical protein
MTQEHILIAPWQKVKSYLSRGAKWWKWPQVSPIIDYCKGFVQESAMRDKCRLSAIVIVFAWLPAVAVANGWLGPDGNNALAVHALGEKGKGVRVGLIAADNARKTHEAFKDKDGRSCIRAYDYTGEGTYKSSEHDTWVAGAVCSRGWAGHENDIGVAPEAELYSAKVTRGIRGPEDANKTTSFAYLAGSLDSLVKTHRCGVIVTGMAFLDTPGYRPDGNSDASLLYDYYAYKHNIIFANASGKQFRAPTVFGDGYNGITVGGLVTTEPNVYGRVGSASNCGPTIDGRRKPDVVAPAGGMVVPGGGADTASYVWSLNDGATSFAVPNVGGIAALLLGLADKTPERDDKRNEVIRAVMINATETGILDKAGRPTDPNGGVTVWHSDRGFGRVDALGSYNTLKAGRVSKDKVVEAKMGWAYGGLSSGQEHIYKIRGEKGERFICTLVWNRKVEWVDSRSRGFIDAGELTGVPTSLGLEVKIGGVRKGWPEGDTSGARDNVLKYDIAVPEDGEIAVLVSYGYGDEGATGYGLAFERRVTKRARWGR